MKARNKKQNNVTGTTKEMRKREHNATTDRREETNETESRKCEEWGGRRGVDDKNGKCADEGERE